MVASFLISVVGFFGATQHHGGALAFQDDDAILVSSDMTKAHDTAIGLGLGGAFFDDFGGDVESVAMKRGRRVSNAFVAEVSGESAFGEVVHGDADSKAEREDAGDKAAAKLWVVADDQDTLQRSRRLVQPTQTVHQQIFAEVSSQPHRTTPTFTDSVPASNEQSRR